MLRDRRLYAVWSERGPGWNAIRIVIRVGSCDKAGAIIAEKSGVLTGYAKHLITDIRRKPRCILQRRFEYGVVIE